VSPSIIMRGLIMCRIRGFHGLEASSYYHSNRALPSSIRITLRVKII
jgi:hypothetical protein